MVHYDLYTSVFKAYSPTSDLFLSLGKIKLRLILGRLIFKENYPIY